MREREISWNQTWAKIQWKPEQECVRGSVSECVSMRELNTPLGLYLKKLGECTRGGARHNGQVAIGEGGAQKPLALGRPTCGVGRPQGWPPGVPLRSGASSTVKFFENMVHGQNFASKDVQIIFSQRILKLKKYF